FIRPKFEYGLAICKFTQSDFQALERLQDKCLRMIVGGHPSSSTTVLKHLCNLPSMRFRADCLVARYCLRASTLPSDCLLSLLTPTLSSPRLDHLRQNPLFVSLPSPRPSSLKPYFSQIRQKQFDRFLATTSQVLIKACRPVLGIDPILTVPATRTERSRLLRWRIGWLPGRPKECACLMDHTSRRHLRFCRAIPPTLWDSLPIPSVPGTHPIDAALNALPTKPGSPCPPFWSDLLMILYHIEVICNPDGEYPPEPDAGSLWLSPSSGAEQ
ncbi:hypothetical protein EC973_004295, partial [Apophysomyces ossiformis]